MKRFILYLVRKRLGLSMYEPFQFTNQKSNAVYYFNEDGLMKAWHGIIIPSHVSLNWILDDECEIKKCGEMKK